MKASFEYMGHKIVIDRDLTRMKLIIDGETQQINAGILKNQLKNCSFQGEILEGRDKGKKVKVDISIGFFADKATLFYDGKKIDSRRFV